MNNVFGKILQVEQLFALLLELHSLAPERLRQNATKERDHQKAERIA